MVRWVHRAHLSLILLIGYCERIGLTFHKPNRFRDHCAWFTHKTANSLLFLFCFSFRCWKMRKCWRSLIPWPIKLRLRRVKLMRLFRLKRFINFRHFMIHYLEVTYRFLRVSNLHFNHLLLKRTLSIIELFNLLYQSIFTIIGIIGHCLLFWHA